MAVRRARGQSLTILGDIMQRTADAGVSRWASLLTEAGVREHVVRDLRYSYRVPGDFLRLAAGVLPEPERIPTGVRIAPWPAIATQAPVSDLGVVTRALAARMADDAGSVGVVVPARGWRTCAPDSPRSRTRTRVATSSAPASTSSTSSSSKAWSSTP